MRVGVTGNLGFVGSETCKLLKDYFGFDIMQGGDIRDKRFLDFWVNDCKPQRILHLAAIARFTDADRNPTLAYETNILGTKNVVEVCKKYSLPLVYASTGSVYMPIEGSSEPPITEDWPAKGNSVYGCTKFIGEEIVRTHNPHIILRYSHIYGKEKRMYGLIGNFLDRIQRGLQPEMYGGKQSADFTYIKDIAQANLLSLNADWDKWNQTYNIGTGEEVTVEEAIKILCDLTGYRGEITRLQQRTVDANRFVYDISKAKKMLGYKPKYNFRRGLSETLR